jgi:hypothetical protein
MGRPRIACSARDSVMRGADPVISELPSCWKIRFCEKRAPICHPAIAPETFALMTLCRLV